MRAADNLTVAPVSKLAGSRCLHRCRSDQSNRILKIKRDR
jgi:hypothetical protein